MDGIRLRRWTDVDLALLTGANTEAMTEHLGGPESDAEVLRRHERYLRGWDVGMPRMFAIVDARGRGLGTIGWWEATLPDGADAYETGWAVLPEHQRKGVGLAALRLVIEDLRSRVRDNASPRRPLAAFPSVTNPASNALCEAAGFERRGMMELDFRRAHLVTNVWVLEV